MKDISDMVALVHDQLPAALKPKLGLSVRCDAFRIRGEAVFEDARGGRYTCTLEQMEFNGRMVACKIPEVFLAHLCAVV